MESNITILSFLGSPDEEGHDDKEKELAKTILAKFLLRLIQLRKNEPLREYLVGLGLQEEDDLFILDQDNWQNIYGLLLDKNDKDKLIKILTRLDAPINVVVGGRKFRK